jgi:hypothetical protein
VAGNPENYPPRTKGHFVMGIKVIGIDLDATLASYSGWLGCPNIGEPYPGAAGFLSYLKSSGWTVCIWTTRAEGYVRNWMVEHGLAGMVDYVNESPYPTDSNKQSFDVYIGDEAIRFTGGGYQRIIDEVETTGKSRHWGEDSFERNVVESDRNPLQYYQGTGKLYLDIFDGLTEKLWSTKTEYRPIALLTICSHAKPYSKSWIHCEIRKSLHETTVMAGQSHTKILNQIDYIHISSAGIIPHEAGKTESLVNRYDWNGADIKKEEVRELLRDRIKTRLQNWYSNFGIKYQGIIVYLRPSGNTMKAVVEAKIPCKIPFVQEYPSPGWLEFPDVDDCLADPRNLQVLQMHTRNEALKRWDHQTIQHMTKK